MASSVRFSRGTTVVVFGLLTACFGRVGDSTSTSSPPPPPPPDRVDPLVCRTQVPANAPAPMRRLTRREYDATVYDLLGEDRALARQFVAEASQFGFDNNAEGATTSALVVEQFENAATIIAQKAVADLDGLLVCEDSEAEPACIERFVVTFGGRAFRRPLTAEEQQRYLSFYQLMRADSTRGEAVELLLRAFLQSPHFLFRLELAGADPSGNDAVPLGPFEMASRLSYLLLGSMPDAALFEAASRDELGTPEQLRAQAVRLLASERGGAAIRDFMTQWSGLSTLAAADRENSALTPAVRAALGEELAMFSERVVRDDDGRWQTLMTAPYSYRNAELAAFYGHAAPSGPGFQRVELDASRYGGVLTQAGPMALLAHSLQPSPVLRGKFILDRLLCAPPPPPPNNVDTRLPPIDPNATARQQLEQKTGVSPCSNCHSLLNPAGFAFEHFDETGRWRNNDHGLPIDASGSLANRPGAEFTDHQGLIAWLAESGAVRGCQVLQWFRYAHGRDRGDADSCSLAILEDSFTTTDGNLRDLLVALTQTPSFRYRSRVVGGGP